MTKIKDKGIANQNNSERKQFPKDNETMCYSLTTDLGPEDNPTAKSDNSSTSEKKEGSSTAEK